MALSVIGIMITSQNKVANILSSFFETAVSSVDCASKFLPLETHEERELLNLTTGVVESYDSVFYECTSERLTECLQ